jgi:hypothetical protein
MRYTGPLVKVSSSRSVCVSEKTRGSDEEIKKAVRSMRRWQIVWGDGWRRLANVLEISFATKGGVVNA